MTQPYSVVLRPMSRDEHDLHAHFHGAATASQWAATTMNPDQIASLIRVLSEAQIAQYHERFPHAASSAIEVDGEPAGRVIVDHGPAAVRVLDLVLLENARGRGLGTKILTDLHRTASEQGVPLLASVDAGNHSARSLYARLGFVELPVPDGDPGLSIDLEWPPDS